MTIMYLRTQNRLTCIWSAMRGGAVPGRTKSAIRCGGMIIGRAAAATLASGWVSRSCSKPRLEGRSP
jgi:hypothetical protein